MVEGVAAKNVACLEEPHEVLAHMVKQAESGDAQAMERLGSFYQKGGEGSKLQAVRWLEKAARAGRTGAMTKLAMLHLYGGVQADEVKALEWLHKASDAGVPVAMNELGRVLQEGRAGQKPDPVRAAELFKRAAAQGHAPSMVNLGAACLVGRGVPKDTERAKRLVSRAAASGDQEAVKLLAAIEQQGGVSELVRGANRSAARSPETTTSAFDRDECTTAASSSNAVEAQASNDNGRGGGRSLSSPPGGATSLPWRPMRISAMPVFGGGGGGGGVDDGAVTPNGVSKDDIKNGELDELDDVPDMAASGDAAVATRPKRPPPGKKSSETAPVDVGPDEADAAHVLSRQFSLIDEVLTSSRAGAKGILEPDVALPLQNAVDGAVPEQQSAQSALDEAVRDLIQTLDTDDPADHQGARELPSKDEDNKELKFDADVLAEAAERGHHRAQYWLAQCLLSRNPPGTDPKKIDEDAALAIKWLRIAAENGHGLAACQLGSYYQDGRALVSTQSYQVAGQAAPKTWSRGAIGAKNPVEAAKWLEIGARATRSPPAMWRLAQLLMAKAVSKRDAEAGKRGIMWAENAASAGMGTAAIAVARAYLGGADGAAPIPGVVADYAKARQWANKVPGAQELANYAARLALYSPGPESTTTTTTKKQHSSGGSSDFASSHRGGGGKRPHAKTTNASSSTSQSPSSQSPPVANSADREDGATTTTAAVSPSSNTTTVAAKRRRRRQRAKMQQQMREKQGDENATGDVKAGDEAGELTAAKVFGFGADATPTPKNPNESLPEIFQNHKDQKKTVEQEQSTIVADDAVDGGDLEAADVDEDAPDRFDVQIAAAAAAGAGGTEPRRSSLRSAWRLRRQRETAAAAKTAAAAAAKRTLSHRKRDAAGKRLQDGDDYLDDASAVEAADAATLELLKELDDADAQAQEKRANSQRRRQTAAKSTTNSQLVAVSDESSPRPAPGGAEEEEDEQLTDGRLASPMSVLVTSDEGGADRRRRDVEDDDENEEDSEDESLELLSSLVAPRSSVHFDHPRGTSSKNGRVESAVPASHDSNGGADQHQQERILSPATAETNVAVFDDEDQGEWQTTVRQRRREKRKAQQQTQQQPLVPTEPPSKPAGTDADDADPAAATSDDAVTVPADDTPGKTVDAIAYDEATNAAASSSSPGIAKEDEEAAGTYGESAASVATHVDKEVRSFSPAGGVPPSEDVVASKAEREEEGKQTVSRAWGDDSSDEEGEVQPAKGWGDESSDDEEKKGDFDGDVTDPAEEFREEEMGAEETKDGMYYDDEEYLLDDMDARAAAAAATGAENEALALELARKFESDEYGQVVDAGGWIPAPNKRSRRKGKKT